MHRDNELGVAAHWRYKEGAAFDSSFERKIAWLRQLLEWKDDVADAGEFVAQLKKRLDQAPVEAMLASRQAWHRTLATECEEMRKELQQRSSADRLPMSVYRLMRELAKVLPEDTILATDGNISMMAAQHIIPGKRPYSRFTATTNGCIGVGIPFGIGAKLKDSTRPVVVVSGDMGFGIAGMELETAIRCNVAVVVVVVNNEGLSGGHKQRELYPSGHERVTMFEPGIRYDKIAEAFGMHGEYVEHPDQVGAAVLRALELNKPACINIKVDPYEPYVSEL